MTAVQQGGWRPAPTGWPQRRLSLDYVVVDKAKQRARRSGKPACHTRESGYPAGRDAAAQGLRLGVASSRNSASVVVSWMPAFAAIGFTHLTSRREDRLEPGPRGQSPTPLTLPLPAKRRGEGTASRSSVRMRPKCHLVGGREVTSVRAPSPRLFAGRGAVRGLAIGRTASNTIAAAEPRLKKLCASIAASAGMTRGRREAPRPGSAVSSRNEDRWRARLIRVRRKYRSVLPPRPVRDRGPEFPPRSRETNWRCARTF